MLQRFFEAIQNFFLSIFGGKAQKVEPVIEEDPTPIEVVQNEEPQDGADTDENEVEVEQVSENDAVEIDPIQEDIEFDEEPMDDPIIDEEELDLEEEKPTDTIANQRYLWCLDNGHGILTAGKRSPFFGSDGRTQFREYEFNRDIVAKIMAALDKEGIAYYNVVPEVEIGDFLEGRVRRANTKSSNLPKIYLSIHSNAGPAPSLNAWTPDHVSGIETWYYYGSKKGQKIASIFQKNLIDKTGWVSRGLKSRRTNQFYVLRKTRMTAILTENGFYNNQNQVIDLMKDDVRQAIADAHVQSILEIEQNGL